MVPLIVRSILDQLALWFPDAIFYQPTTEKVIALTIDDAPTPDEEDDRSVQLILQAIDHYNNTQQHCPGNGGDRVKATFFIITGHLMQNSRIIEKILQRDHEIGNHGTLDGNHTLFSPTEFADQLWQAHERLAEFSNTLRWYRPAKGLYNASMTNILRQMPGYEPKFALASMLPLDTRFPTEAPEFTVPYALAHGFPGAILVFHGGTLARSQRTAAVLQSLLPQLAHQGYRVVTLSELWDWNRPDSSLSQAT